MAFRAALEQAGLPDVHHIHYLGKANLVERIRRQSLQNKGGELEPMLQLAIRLSSTIDEPDHSFTVLTGIRDPVAQQISHAFNSAEAIKQQTGVDFLGDQRRASAFFIEHFFARSPLTWFEDHIRSCFSIEYLAHPFDRERGALRAVTPRCRWLVLRLEDPASPKAREIGWLIGRERVDLPVVNEAAAKPYFDAYRHFRENFVAPHRLLYQVYDSPMMRHFYDEAERQAFFDTWAGGRRR